MTALINKKKQLKKLGLRIRQLREQKGMTLQQLGDKVEKDKQSIHRVEAGSMNPSYIYLFEISEGLGLPLTEIIDLKEEKKLVKEK